jgi:hypothetical protein
MPTTGWGEKVDRLLSTFNGLALRVQPTTKRIDNDQVTDPSGNSGDRIACGVIAAAQ